MAAGRAALRLLRDHLPLVSLRYNGGQRHLQGQVCGVEHLAQPAELLPFNSALEAALQGTAP